MSYQEVYNGLNKRASNEQIKKLASIIGMRKKAAEKKEPLGKIDAKTPDTTKSVFIHAPGTPNPKGIKNRGDMYGQWVQHNFGIPVGKSDNRITSIPVHPKQQRAKDWPPKLTPQQAYDIESLRARKSINPFHTSSAAGRFIDNFMSKAHQFKKRFYNSTGMLPTYKDLARFQMLDDFYRDLGGKRDWQDGEALNSDQNLYLTPEEQKAIDDRFKRMQQQSFSPQRVKEWQANPQAGFFDLSQNTHKPSYSQQLYS